jgi:hypothetical protein
MGGLAINAWSIPSPTFDIDLCVDIGIEAVPGLVKGLEEAGFIPPPAEWVEFVGQAKFKEISVGRPFQGGVFPTDLFVELDGFQKEALDRSRPVELQEAFRTPVLLPEDLLVYKLIADRPKDRAAVERLLAVQTELDWPYVRRWAGHYGVVERFREALRQSGLDVPEP